MAESSEAGQDDSLPVALVSQMLAGFSPVGKRSVLAKLTEIHV